MSSTVPSCWFIAAPGNPSKQDTIQKLSEALKKNDFAEIFPFVIPEFKVGTLDSLMILSDELVKSDALMESIVLKLADTLKSLLKGDADQWKQTLLVSDKIIPLYLQSFSWNTMKYRSDKTLKELLDNIMTESNTIDTIMKQKLQNYNNTKSQLTTLLRKQEGNLSTRSLSEVVKKEHFVLDSEYLQTLLVAVPKSRQDEWINKYETLTELVVPRSSILIAEDSEFALYNVVLFQKIATDFTNKAREQKFTVRDFQWDPEKLSSEKRMITELTQSEKEQLNGLLRLCKTNFGEMYASWQHLKVLRLFIESILRYGLPANFQTILVRAKPKQEQQARAFLNKHFAYLEKRGGDKEEVVEESLVGLMGEKDYSPVVLFALNTIY